MTDKKKKKKKGAENKEVHRSAFVFIPKGYPVNIEIDRH